MSETAVFFTLDELKNLNRTFNILSEEALKAHYFTKADIESIYNVIGKVREGIEEIELDEQG